jgi:hypothetical protein
MLPVVGTYYITALQHVFGVVPRHDVAKCRVTDDPLRPRFVEDAANSK